MAPSPGARVRFLGLLCDTSGWVVLRIVRCALTVLDVDWVLECHERRSAGCQGEVRGIGGA